MELSPDGKSLAVCGNGGESQLWDTTTGQAVGAPLKHMSWVNVAKFSPDGKVLVVGCGQSSLQRSGEEPGEARFYDVGTGQQIGPVLAHRQGVDHAEFSPDGKTLATSGSSFLSTVDEVRLWDVATGRPIGSALVHRGSITSVAFRRDGKRLITASQDGTARLWDVATGRQLGPALLHRGPVSMAAFLADGKTALTAGSDGAVCLWDATADRPGGLPLGRTSGSFSGDGRFILTSDNSSARLLDAATRRPMGPPLLGSRYVSFTEIQPNGRLVPFIRDRQTVGFVDALTGRAAKTVLPVSNNGNPRIAFSPDGRIVFVGSASITNESSSGVGQFWDPEAGRPIGAGFSFSGFLIRVSLFSPDSRLFFLGTFNTQGRDGEARFWDATTGQPLGPALPIRGSIMSAAFSPDGKTLVTGTSEAGFRTGQAQLWDVATRQPLGAAMRLSAAGGGVAFSPDGKKVLTVCSQSLGQASEARLWDAASGKPLGPPIRQDGALVAAFHPGGRMFLTGGFNGVRFWDAALGRPIGPFVQTGGAIIKVSFSPDGRIALISGFYSPARLLDTPDLPDDLERASVWIEALTGLEVNAQGDIGALDGAAWQARRERLASLGGSPAAPEPWRFDPILAGSDPTARAKAWADRGLWAEAEAAYNEAVAAWPDDPNILAERARFHAGRGQNDKADADMVGAYALGLDTLSSQLSDVVITRIFEREDLFRRVLALQPSAAPALLVRRATYWARSNSWTRAAADLREADRLDPLPVSSFCDLVVALRAAGDEDQARRAVKELFDRHGKTTHALWAGEMARLALEVSDPGVPFETVRRVAARASGFQSSSDKADGLLTQGLVLYREGRFEDAIGRLDEALRERGNRGSSYQVEWPPLALAHHRLGHRDEARRLAPLLRNSTRRSYPLKQEAEAIILYDPIFPADPFAAIP